MAKTKVVQLSFNGGEVSEKMMGRIDDAKYGAGLSICKNFISLPQGPVQNRAGFAFVDAVKDSSKPVRLIPFQFNYEQTIVVALGDKNARFYTQGHTLMDYDGEPYEIETPWSAEDVFDIHYVQSADVMTLVHPSYPPMELRRYGEIDWRCVAVEYGWKLTAPATVTAKRKAKAAEDKNENNYRFYYAVSCLNADKTEESEAREASYENADPEDVDGVIANLYAYGTTVEVSCSEVADAKFYRFYKKQGGIFGWIGDSETPSIVDDDIDPDMSITPRRYDDPFVVSGGIKSVTVKNGGSNYDVVEGPILRVGKYGYSGSGDEISSQFELPYDFKETSFTTSVVDEPEENGGPEGPGTGAVVEPLWNGKTLTGFRVVSSGANYRNPVVVLTPSGVPGIIYRYMFPCDKDPSGIVLKVKDSSGTGAELRATVNIETGAITGVTVVNGGTGYKGPSISIENTSSGSGAEFEIEFGEGATYPAAVGYYQQRRIFAGLALDPQRIIFSRSGTEADFTYSLPYRDDDCISHQIATTQFNQILHLVPLARLLLLTTGSEVIVSPSNSDVLTPDSFNAQPQSFNGASNVQPVMVNNNVVYCAARGGHVMEYAYQYQAGGYVSGDLCLRSAHLFDFRTISDMAFSKAPVPILWFVSSSGELLGFTYIPEQAVGSWHRHTTDGRFESCCCVAEGQEDVLYCVVRRTVNGQDVRYIERMATRQIDSVEDGFFVDCGGTYRGSPATHISGLDWLEGKTVSILADGSVHPQRVVTNGAIDLENPASIVHVGLPIEAEIRTLPIAIGQMAGYGNGAKKNIVKAFIKVYASRGLFVGPDSENVVEWKQRTTESPGSPILMTTADVSIVPRPKIQTDGLITIRQSDPLPMCVLSVAAEVEVSA